MPHRGGAAAGHCWLQRGAKRVSSRRVPAAVACVAALLSVACSEGSARVSGKGVGAPLRLRGGSQRAMELEELGVLSRVSSCQRLYDLDPFEWEDKSEALDMLKNGVRFHSFTPHAGPDTYTGDMEKTVWWKERGLDRTGGRAILLNKDSLSMSKDIRVRRNGRHRRSFVARNIFQDSPPKNLVDMEHIFACVGNTDNATTADSLGEPFLWGVLSRLPNMIPFLATHSPSSDPEHEDNATATVVPLNETVVAGACEGSNGTAEVVGQDVGNATVPAQPGFYWRALRYMFGPCMGGGGTDGAQGKQATVEGNVSETMPVEEELTGEEVNDQLVEVLMKTIEGDDWEEICNADGIRVCRNKLSPDLMIAGRPVGDASKFLCVKAEAILEASPEKVYSLFVDNSRVREYNEFCKQIKDLEYINSTTKVTWSASARIGPFKERDFVTRVHYRTLPDDTLLVVNRAEDHRLAPQTDRYLRMEIVLGGNVMRSIPGRKDRTQFTMLTHVNPGGVAETRLGTMIMNSAAANGPTKFVQGLRECLARDAAGIPPPAIMEENEMEIEFGRTLLDTKITDMHTREMLQTCPAAIT